MSANPVLPAAVFEGGRLLPGLALHPDAGGAVLRAPSGEERALAGIVTPGLCDLQVNGGGGVLFNADPTPDGLAAIVAAHRAVGTSGLMATVITDAPGVLRAAATAVRAAWGLQGLLGLHIEGPHISVAKRGTHAPEHIRPLDAETLDAVAMLRSHGIPVKITVAPEVVPPEAIARLAAMGAIVSLGHSTADAATVDKALAAGARCFTHLFNAMSPMEGRAPGMVGAAILSRADVGLICDGHHVADAMVRLAILAHGTERMHLVSDAMPTVGGPAGFMLYGRPISLSDGRIVNAEGKLAGAHLALADAVRRIAGPVGFSLEQALAMAITNPARVIGLDGADRVTGKAAEDLLFWPDDGSGPVWLDTLT